MITTRPASEYNHWQQKWQAGKVLSVDKNCNKITVKHKPMITHHTQLLNALIDKYGLKSYLEIGVQNPANNFDKVNVTGKVGVDPCLFVKEDTAGNRFYSMSSDDFFSAQCGLTKFDLIFIDGLHHADQVKRDFENSLRCLSDNGFIVIHDVLPENEAGTIVPRETKQWWGDVYKWAMNIDKYSGIDWVTFDIDNGCMVVRKTETVRPQFDHFDYTWHQYIELNSRIMNVTSTVEI